MTDKPNLPNPGHDRYFVLESAKNRSGGLEFTLKLMSSGNDELNSYSLSSYELVPSELVDVANELIEAQYVKDEWTGAFRFDDKE